jgi:signal transduction histidine kinase
VILEPAPDRGASVADVSQELRAPLTSVLGFLELLLEDDAEEPQAPLRVVGSADATMVAETLESQEA